MSSKRIVYKVVSTNDQGHLMSAMAFRLPDNYPVKYVPGKRTVARYRKHRLMSFSTKMQARAFIGYRSWFEVWRAEAEDAVQVSFLPGLGLSSRRTFAPFWRLFRKRGPKAGRRTPTGTLACTSIKLIARVA